MTKSQNSYAGLTPYEVSNVRHRARCLALKPDLGLAVEDIEQELFAHILEKRACFDPERASWPTFVDRILLTKTIDMLVSARAPSAVPAPRRHSTASNWSIRSVSTSRRATSGLISLAALPVCRIIRPS